jgi:hypothetical protein
MKQALSAFLLLFFGLNLQSNAQLSKSEIIEASEAELRNSLLEFREYLGIPNNGKVPSDTQLNLEWTKAALEKRGFKTQILTSNDVPHLFAQGEIDPK